MRGTFDVAADIDGAPRGYYPPPRHRVTYRSAVTRFSGPEPPLKPPSHAPTCVATTTASPRRVLRSFLPPSPPHIPFLRVPPAHVFRHSIMYIHRLIIVNNMQNVLPLIYLYFSVGCGIYLVFGFWFFSLFITR